MANFSNQKVYEKLNFGGFVVKAADSHFAWFCSLLHTSLAAEKAQLFIQTGPWFFTDVFFIFAVYFDTYVLLGRK